MTDQMNKMGGKHPGTMPKKNAESQGTGTKGAKSPKYKAANQPGKSGEKCSY